MKTMLWTVARFTLVDMLRSSWLWLCLAAALAVASVATFAGGLALTERHEIILTTIAPLARLCCVAVVALLGASALVREIQERTWLLMLAAPMSRSLWLVGKWLGLSIAAAISALLLSIPVLILQPGINGFIWAGSLLLESVLVAALLIAAALSFKQVPATLFATASFYFASRVIGLAKLLNDRAPIETTGLQTISHGLIEGLALLLPRLDIFTSTSWLFAKEQATFDLSIIAFQVVLYSGLALTAACIDLNRKDLFS